MKQKRLSTKIAAIVTISLTVARDKAEENGVELMASNAQMKDWRSRK